MDEQNLATEILHELKANAKRWFIAFLIVLVLWFGTIGLFVWYISLPIEEEYIIDQQSTDRSFNIVGGDYNGFETNNTEKETPGS